MLYIHRKQSFQVISDFFGNFSKKIHLWTLTLIVKKRAATVSLILATFFNPLGFDAAFALVTKWTDSYVLTDIIFYGISACFFGLYFLLKKNSPST